MKPENKSQFVSAGIYGYSLPYRWDTRLLLPCLVWVSHPCCWHHNKWLAASLRDALGIPTALWKQCLVTKVVLAYPTWPLISTALTQYLCCRLDTERVLG